jgi:hypothetical protein
MRVNRFFISDSSGKKTAKMDRLIEKNFLFFAAIPVCPKKIVFTKNTQLVRVCCKEPDQRTSMTPFPYHKKPHDV